MKIDNVLADMRRNKNSTAAQMLILAYAKHHKGKHRVKTYDQYNTVTKEDTLIVDPEQFWQAVKIF